MPTAAKKKLKLFHATMHVTRVEEWCVEAETPEEARALLASGKQKGETISAPKAPAHSNVVNLMDALRKSVEGNKSAKLEKRKPAHKPAKKTTKHSGTAK
jgi:non-homologous end joining protein Ku